MCSILGLVSYDDVASTIVKSLERMECRGYDSVDLAIKNVDSNILVTKGVGKIKTVNNEIQMDKLSGNSGIDHIRWATHGGVTIENAHPHLCNSGSVGVVHNGIIENYAELREELEKDHGIIFKSSTDTEVIPNLLQVNFEKSHDIKQMIMNTTQKLKGHYAFVALFNSGEIAGVRNHDL